MVTPFQGALSRGDFAEAQRFRNLRTPYEAGQFGSLLTSETWTTSIEGMVFQPYLIYPNASKSDLDKSGKVVTYGANLRQPLRVSSGEESWQTEDPGEEWIEGKVSNYSFTGNWKLDESARALLEQRLGRALKETGMSVLPMKVLDSSEDLATWRENWGPPAQRMSVGNRQQPLNVKPVYLIRGLGAYAGGSAVSKNLEAAFMTVGDSVIEALAGYTGPTAFEKIQVAEGKSPTHARFMASYQSQMGTVLHEALHQMAAMPHTSDEAMVEDYSTNWSGAHGDKFMQAIEDSIRGTRPEDSMAAMRLVMGEPWNYGWGAPGTEPAPIAPAEGISSDLRIPSDITPPPARPGGGVIDPSTLTSGRLTSEPTAPSGLARISASSLSDKLEKASNNGTARSDVMALVHRFAKEFTDIDYRNPSFWQEAVNDGSISERETPRASVEVRAPSGTTYWVQPGEVTNLRAQGWSIGPPVPASAAADILGKATSRQVYDETERLIDGSQGADTGVTLQNVASFTPGAGDIAGGGGTAPIGAPQQNAINKIIQQIDDELIKDEDAAWNALRKAVGNQEEAVRLWFEFIEGAEYKRATAKWAEDFVSEKDQEVEGYWSRVLADGSQTWNEVLAALGRDEGLDDRPGMLSRLEAKYGAGAVTVKPEDQGPPGGQPGRRADDPWSLLSTRWDAGHYQGDLTRLIDDIIETFPDITSREAARSAFTAKTAEGFFQSKGGEPPGTPGVLGDRPQAGRFSQFAKFREVDPELGGPAGRELERQFEPLERAYSAYSALSPYIDPIDPDIDVTAPGYAPQTFSEYLTNRGGSLQSARMGSFDILRRLGEMTPVGREQQGLLFGNVYDEQGSPLTTGVKGFRQTQMDQAIADAAAAQYGRRGGEFVGGQLPRQRRLFEAQQQSEQGAEATNFFDYIRNKYGLQF